MGHKSLGSHNGPFIFYEVGGAGGIWGGHPQKNGLKGGAIPKKTEGSGGVTRNILVHVELT